MGLACLYFAVGMLGLLLAFGFGRAQIIWSSTGVAFAGLALFGIRYWPAIAVADVLLSLAAGYSPATCAGVMVAKVLEAVAGVYLYRRYAGRRNNFRQVRDVVTFVLAAAASSALGAAIGLGAMALGGTELVGNQARVWANWAFGDLVSDLVLAPFLVNLASAPWRAWRSRQRWEAAALLLAILATAAAVFTKRLVLDQLLIPFTFPLFPLLVWAALRFEQTGASVASLLVTFLSLFIAARGTVAFDQTNFNRALLTVHGYMFVLTISGYCLAAAVTERRLAVERSQGLSEQLRALSQRMDTAREEERVRLSRELHDQLGQQLTGLGLAVSSLSKKLPPGSQPLRAKAGEINDILHETISIVQRISTELRPGVVNELSITEALQWLSEKFAADADVPVTFRNEAGQVHLDDTAKVNVFRIFQEAFANITRHAHATAAVLEVQKMAGGLRIALQDDGVGIPPAARAAANSLGLVGMRERALSCGAQVRVDHSPFFGTAERPGTMVEVLLPLPH
jgi:signal transduction histidine kinase